LPGLCPALWKQGAGLFFALSGSPSIDWSDDRSFVRISNGQPQPHPLEKAVDFGITALTEQRATFVYFGSSNQRF
jgi:hypothetical protein